MTSADTVADASRSVKAFNIYRKDYSRRILSIRPSMKSSAVLGVVTQNWHDNEELKAKYNGIAELTHSLLDQYVAVQAAVGRAIYAHSKLQLDPQISVEQDNVEKEKQFRSKRFVRSLSVFGTSEEEQLFNFQTAWKSWTSFGEAPVEDILKLVAPDLNVHALYSKVVWIGGFLNVSKRNLWPKVVGYFDLIQDERVAVIILQSWYFQHCFEFEQSYQRTRVQVPKEEPMVSLGLVQPPNNQNAFNRFTGNYYTTTGAEALYLSLISGCEADVAWALNELLVMSYNQDQEFYFDVYPPILDALVQHLQQNTFARLDIRTEHSICVSDLFKSTLKQENTCITSQDPGMVILTIISNLSILPQNHKACGQHGALVPTILLLGNHSVDMEFLVALIMGNISHFVELGTAQSWLKQLNSFLDRCLSSTGPLKARLALQCITYLAARRSNDVYFSSSAFPDALICAIVSKLHWVPHTPDQEILIVSLECVLMLVRMIEVTKVRLIHRTECLRLIVTLLGIQSAAEQKGTIREKLQSEKTLQELEDSTNYALSEDVDNETSMCRRVRRTAAAMLNMCFQQPANWKAYYDMSDRIFESCARHHEVSHFLSPILAFFAAEARARFVETQEKTVELAAQAEVPFKPEPIIKTLQ